MNAITLDSQVTYTTTLLINDTLLMKSTRYAIYYN